MVKTNSGYGSALQDLVALAREEPAGMFGLLRAMGQISVGAIIHRLDAMARPEPVIPPRRPRKVRFEVIEGGVSSWKGGHTTMRSPRVNVNKAVWINDRFEAECINLSNEGMFIFTSRKFEIDTELDLSLDLGGDHLLLEGKVRHCQPDIGFGVKLERPPRQLKRYVGMMLAGR